MKQTIIPAQITTVEDKIAGNLTLTQLLLLSLPVFLDLVFYVLLPPLLKFSVYKLVPIFIASTLSWLSAIRIKNKILLSLIITRIKYNLRPRYYIFNKNDDYLRSYLVPVHAINQDEPAVKTKPSPQSRSLTSEDIVRLNQLLEISSFNLQFESNKKAGLHVYLSEIE